MSKFIFTLTVAALTLGTFAQENDSTTEHRRSHERGRMHERGKKHEHGRMQGRRRSHEHDNMQRSGQRIDASMARFTDSRFRPGEGNVAVKGGAFDSKRTECRTETRTESSKANSGYPKVTFRVIREDR